MKKNEIISNLLNDFLQIRKDYMTAVNNVLSDVKNYSAQKSKIILDCDLSRTSQFNIFETISDLYTREKFHSDILDTILNPKTPEIGPILSEDILTKFLEMIDSKYFTIDDTVKVSKEVYNKVLVGKRSKIGYIDLLITNEHNQAIIIENKINDAPDQPNQIVRYMKYINEQYFQNNKPIKMTVVYLTLNPGKKPKIKEYDEFFNEYKDKLLNGEGGREILKYRSAVVANEKVCLVGFLTTCIEILENYIKQIKGSTVKKNAAILKRVYLEQYKCLLNHIGGKVTMLKCQKELLQKIYSTQETLNAAKDLVKVWTEKDESKSAVSDLKHLIDSSEDSRKAANDLVEVFSDKSIVNQFINDCLRDFVEPLGFSFEDGMYIHWNDTRFLYVYGYDAKLEIGFGGKKITQKQEESYKEILKKFKKKTDKVRDGGYDFVFIRIEPLSGKKNIQEFLAYYTKLLSEIIKKEFKE